MFKIMFIYFLICNFKLIIWEKAPLIRQSLPLFKLYFSFYILTHVMCRLSMGMPVTVIELLFALL